MDPVWMLYRRRIFSRLAYWLSALGYNLRDRSATNRMYLVYFCLFWLVWVTAVLALLGRSAAELSVLLALDPAPAAANLVLAGLAAWALAQLWQAIQRSPFVFTEEDAYLICQTPVSRRRVGLALYLQGWGGSLLPFVAGALILAFALAEIQVWRAGSGFAFGVYILNSLQAVSIVLPLQAALLAAVWGVGALRLRGRELPWLRPAALLLAGLWVAAWLAASRWPWLFAALYAPLDLPLQAAFGAGAIPWLAGLAISLLLLALALAFLVKVTPFINLGQAAQETGSWAIIQMARGVRYAGLAEAILLRQRLGSAHAPSGLLRAQGAGVLFDKDGLQSRRAFTPGRLLPWVWVFAFSLGIFLPANWLLGLVMAGLWTLTVGSLATRRLRSDLARWWVLRSLPIRSTSLLRAELRLPLSLVILLGWGAVLLASVPSAYGILAAILLPFLAASAALSAAYDILRRSQARALMSPSIAEENVPRPDVWGALQGLGSVLLPFGLLAWANANAMLGLWGWAAILLAVAITWFNFRSAVAAFRWVG
jgi:hypothetical protein